MVEDGPRSRRIVGFSSPRRDLRAWSSRSAWLRRIGSASRRAAARSSAPGSRSPSRKARRRACFTAFSISAPVYPSLSATRRPKSNCWGSRPRFRRWISQICRRSSGAGTSNHQTASSRRRNSGGIRSGRLAVPTRKNGARASCSQVSRWPNTRAVVPLSVWAELSTPPIPFSTSSACRTQGLGFHDTRHSGTRGRSSSNSSFCGTCTLGAPHFSVNTRPEGASLEPDADWTIHRLAPIELNEISMKVAPFDLVALRAQRYPVARFVSAQQTNRHNVIYFELIRTELPAAMSTTEVICSQEAEILQPAYRLAHALATVAKPDHGVASVDCHVPQVVENAQSTRQELKRNTVPSGDGREAHPCSQDQRSSI